MTAKKKSISPPVKKMRVAVAQMKFEPRIEDNLRTIHEMTVAARRRKAAAVLFPECATTGYHFDFSRLRPGVVREAVDCVRDQACVGKINILLGTPLFADGKLYNCLLAIDRQGNLVHAYAKCQLTAGDRGVFTPGNAVSLFELDGVTMTSIICHERRYPELVRIPAMAGARIVFHPNAGLDTPAVSRSKRGGCDGIAVRAFENGIYYAFANSVGAQGKGKWSAGDSKIVAPDGGVLALADNRGESVEAATLDLRLATGRYARESMEQPKFLSAHWAKMVGDAVAQSRKESDRLLSGLGACRIYTEGKIESDEPTGS